MAETPTAPDNDGNPKRRRALIIVAAVFGSIGLAWLLWWWLVLARRETTNDAYVAGNQIAVSSQVGGTVVSLLADDTQRVEAGQLLMQLDPTDAALALARAAAALDQAVHTARQMSATASQYDAQVEGRRAELQLAEAQLARRRPLLADQAISAEEIKQAESAVTVARAMLQSAERQASAAHALTAGLSPEKQAAVLEARVQYQLAWVNAHRGRVLAPATGYVARRSVQAGQRVQPGEPLLTIVPLDNLWIDANFKEPQLRALRLGQVADVTADIYGGEVHYRGRVAGVAAGTGAAFSLLPAQNASGNWVKVVQRVPVRIELDAAELAQHPLRVGLSANVNVNTTDRSGVVLAATDAQRPPVAQTGLYESDAAAAEQAADAIINGGIPVQP